MNKRQAIQQDLAAHGLRAFRQGAVERLYTDEEGRVRMVEHIGKSQIVETHLTPEGEITGVTVGSVKAELKAIKRYWDELAPRATVEHVQKFIAMMREPASTQQQRDAARIALGHIWRRRKDLREAIKRAVASVGVS